MSTLAPILVPTTDADADYVCTAGTAILSKVKPLSVDYTLPGHPDAAAVKGRIVTLEFERCYLVGTYVVNAGTGLKVRAQPQIHTIQTTHVQRIVYPRVETRGAVMLNAFSPRTHSF